MQVWLGVLALCAVLSCRVLPPEDYWIESHGRTSLQQIAAFPQGVVGIGSGQNVYLYPGDFGVPWKVFQRVEAQHVAASPRAAYVLDKEGYVWSSSAAGRASRWHYSRDWGASALGAGDGDELYVIVSGKAFRVARRNLEPLGCTQTVTALTAARGTVYLVSPEGALSIARDDGCENVPVPGPVTSAAAYADQLVVVVKGVAYERGAGGAWRALPQPVRYREEVGSRVVPVAEVARSANCLWARDQDGFVYVLSETS